MKWDVLTLERAKSGEVELADSVFGLDVRSDILHRMVNYQLAKRRRGTHKVRERGEVQGSNAKMYRQKGTGRARHSTRKANIFRGGGVVHGPRPRSHAHKLPKKVRVLALRHALSAKVAAEQLVVVELPIADSARTKELSARLRAFEFGSVLVITGSEEVAGFARAARNLPGIDVLPVEGANVYDILQHEALMIVPEAVRTLEARLR